MEKALLKTNQRDVILRARLSIVFRRSETFVAPASSETYTTGSPVKCKHCKGLEMGQRRVEGGDEVDELRSHAPDSKAMNVEEEIESNLRAVQS